MSKSKRKNIRNEQFLKSFGIHLRKIREGKGMTQQDLADEMDVEVMQVSRIERGIVNTSISMIREITNALELPLSELFAEFEKS